MQVVILCGGRGSRLGSWTTNCPKPLLPVGGKPFLDHVITEYAEHQDARRFFLIAGYLGEQVADAYKEWGQWRGLEIHTYIEKEPKGTLNALWAAWLFSHMTLNWDHRFLLANGDTLIRSTTAIRNFHAKAVAFRIRQVDCGLRLFNTGWLFDKPSYFSQGPSIEQDLFPQLGDQLKWQSLNKDESLFIDIGTPENYERAKVIFR